MLITPRIYSASQTPDRIVNSSDSASRPRFRSLEGWKSDLAVAGQTTEMLLVRQTGSVRVGEVVRYTLTYDSASDNIQPSLDALHVKIKNTSAIPLRAAYLHGPYTLYASCYPASFDPNAGSNTSRTDHTPQFEPYLKAGGTWNALIPVPAYNSQENHSPTRNQDGHSSTWIIEIISQVIFSSTASVNFEVLVGRNEASLDIPTSRQLRREAADLRDHWPSGSTGKQLLATKGVYSHYITLLVDDTASLWNTPHLPLSRSDDLSNDPPMSGGDLTPGSANTASGAAKLATNASQKEHRKRIHLVVLTHGMHSNLGADMLYLKERIDAASKKAASQRKNTGPGSVPASETASLNGLDENCQEEQVVVRGFPGNAARTERGIQYLGKRLAKYVLLMTYPDQPHLPHRKPKARTYPNPFSWKGQRGNNEGVLEASSTDVEPMNLGDHHAYQITSISFIGHSLGGLVQTYAIAYIQKHSPDFFDKIRPINFIALATPFLGLSNENPMYVRFALDFGLVGRTGQDLGLSWTAPRVRSGWETVIGGTAESSKSQSHSDARAKPLLRILPSGPAHEVLTKFKHRTVYSNLVNDGIVPLRTSCLLFLDWKGLERVDKARRENGIVGTMAEWGWAELTGANSKSPRLPHPFNDLGIIGASSGVAEDFEDISITASSHRHTTTNFECSPPTFSLGEESAIQVHQMIKPSCVSALVGSDAPIPQPPTGPLSTFFSMFKPREPGDKNTKILKRSQTVATSIGTNHPLEDDHYYKNWSYDGGFNAPPKTTVFESAGDILMPPLPPMEYIMNPASRPRTVLHDRTYRAEDIPPPVTKRKTQPLYALSPDGIPKAASSLVEEPLSGAGLKIEEKIARAYHRGLSWRKCLVRLEPDAHNNIIVRRMFSNAYGWPVVEHLVNTHFGSGFSRTLEDSSENIPAGPVLPVAPADDNERDFTSLSSPIIGPHVA
ncbi:putative serine esterase-domain-containing protein [Aspergillus pseudoustus]|uniref:Serine esterase-domain-containing protein n=1 Tax=Aspergillus pseudoustus TaxID=1810923 RepID=A0ABR4J903_9EURO